MRSPSPRKAWIETLHCLQEPHRFAGRLPPGRRGLKHRRKKQKPACLLSPSPRKAWIETISIPVSELNLYVAFPPEGVD